MFLFGSQGPDGWGDMVIFAFVAILFHVLALGLLFSPLLHWIRQRMRLYVVTTRRALVLGPFFFAAAWSRRRLIPPDRADHCNGLTDIWLVRRSSADSWRGAELAAPVVQPSGDGLADLHFAAEETRYGIEPIGFPANAAAAREALLLIPSTRRTAA